MANGDFFSNMMGFSSKYTETAKSQSNDETDYEGVDFCQGEDVQENKLFLFGEEDSYSAKSYDSDDCLFNFEAEYEDDLG